MLPQAKTHISESPKSLSELGGLEGRSPSRESLFGVHARCFEMLSDSF